MVIETEKSKDLQMQAEDPGEPIVQFQLEFKGLSTMRTKAVHSHPSSKTNVPAQRQAERENYSLLQLLVLVRPSVDWMRPTHTEDGNLLYLVK